MERESYDVFLSYASEDEEIAAEVTRHLTSIGYRVFLDRLEVLAGENIVERVFGVIANSRYFAILLTANATNSRWVKQELSAAKIREIEGATVLLPLLYEDCPIPDALIHLNYIDFRRSLQNGMSGLEDALRAHEERRVDGPSRFPADTGTQPQLGDSKVTLLTAINGDQHLYIVMDLGGTKAYVSLMNDEAERLFDKKFSTEGHRDPEQLFTFIKACIRQTIDNIHESCGIRIERVRKRITACGIAFPGPTDSDRGVILNAPNLGVSNFPLAERIESAIEMPTFIDNDVNLGVLGEAWKGAAKGCKNVVGIIIGTGIGGGVLIDGKIYRGSTKAAGEVGHMILDVDSEHVCPCGQRGCFEALASRKSMARDIHVIKLGNGDTAVTWEERNLGSNDIVHYYEHGDPDIVAVVSNAARICGKAVFSVINGFNPEIVILSGGFIKQFEAKQLGDAFLAPIREEVEKCMNALYVSTEERVPIRIGELDNPMLVGACKMVIDKCTGRATYDMQYLMEAVASGLGDEDLRLLHALYRQKVPPLISGDPGSDFYRDRLRALRNHGLIETVPGPSFRKSETVRISRLGQIVIEHNML